MKRVLFILIVMVMASTLSGCYWKREVQTSQVGLEMNDGVTVSDFKGSGRYTDMGFYADLVLIDVSAKTTAWSDPDLVTKDKQPIGLSLGITYARARDAESIERMWDLYRGEAQDNERLEQQVLNRIPRIAKEITTKYTLDEMLGVAASDVVRSTVSNDLFDILKKELEEVYITLLDVGINNIAPSDQYMALLEKKANAQVAVEVARSKTLELREQLEQEKAQTEIELEKARRDNAVNEELSRVYEQSPQFFELERLRLLQGVVGENDKIYFIPEGTDLSLILGGSGFYVDSGD